MVASLFVRMTVLSFCRDKTVIGHWNLYKTAITFYRLLSVNRP